MKRIKEQIEERAGHRYHVCVCLHYPDGTHGCGFHQDLTAYGAVDSIASLSLGAVREFVLRSCQEPDQSVHYHLPHGSLIIMGDGCQENFQHGILEEPAVTERRLNLTFRKFGY